MEKSYYFDALDVWSLRIILSLYVREKVRVVNYFARAEGFQWLIVKTVLNLLSIEYRQCESAYRKSGINDIYTRLRREAGELQFGFIESAILKWVEELKLSSKGEELRFARYVTFHAWKYLNQNYEAIRYLSDCVSRDLAGVVFYVGDLLFAPEIVKHYSSSGVDIRPYKSLLRVFRKRDKEYLSIFEHKYSTSYAAVFLMVSYALALRLIFVAAAILRGELEKYLKKGGDAKCEKFDIVAYVHQDTEFGGNSDLFWAQEFKMGSRRRVLAVSRKRHSGECEKFYRDVTNEYMVISDFAVTFLNLKNSTFGRVAKASLEAISKSKVLNLAIRGRIPPWATPIMLSFEQSCAYYQGLLMSVNAKCAWAMIEANDTNSVALTIASERVGGACFGTSWSLQHSESINEAVARNQIMFVWGLRHKLIYEKSRALVDLYIPTGYPTIDYYLWEGWDRGRRPEWLENIMVESNKKYVVTFYDNAVAENLPVNFEIANSIVEGLVNWLEERDDVLLIFKTKRESMMLSYKSRVDRLMLDKKVVVRSQKSDLQSGLAADVVCGWGACTLACVAASYGVNCVLYDDAGQLAGDLYTTGLSNVITARTVAEYINEINDALGKVRRVGAPPSYLNATTKWGGESHVAWFIGEYVDSYEKYFTQDELRQKVVEKYFRHFAPYGWFWPGESMQESEGACQLSSCRCEPESDPLRLSS